jgi:hypothetical protein
MVIGGGSMCLSTTNGHCSWINLKINDINEVFLALISLKAASREFKGKCDICRAKPGSNRKVA